MKLIFIKETDATALFPGGFGTNDEGFEAITLIHERSRGIPRTISVLCDNALLNGFAQSVRPVHWPKSISEISSEI